MPAITFVLTPKGSLLIGFKGEGPRRGPNHETGHRHVLCLPCSLGILASVWGQSSADGLYAFSNWEL